ncbi:hypothetical protein PAV_8c01250 [Paenibacillus alvei DSM 29]|nr:hypothetical protein PAV_8c01250 [Paenibacillus alvei DSM 29]
MQIVFFYFHIIADILKMTIVCSCKQLESMMIEVFFNLSGRPEIAVINRPVVQLIAVPV